MASYEKRTWWSRHLLTDRLKDASFLEAAINSAFLIAAADGTVSDVEYDALLDRLVILGDVDRDRVDELLTVAAKQLEAMGLDSRVAHVAELVEHADAAEAALMVGMAIALADNVVTSDERQTATKLAEALGLASINLDTMVNEIRG